MDTADKQDSPSGSSNGASGASSTSSTSSPREQLISDLKLVMKDAEALLKSGGQQFDSTYQSARERFASTMQTAKGHYSNMESKFMDSSKDAYSNASRYVKENPWQAVGIGAAVGVLLGMLIGRDRDE